MLLLHDYKLIYIHVHRTAGTALSEVLREISTDYLETQNQHANMQTQELQFIQTHPDYTVVGVARNPWDRIASWYSLLHKSRPLELKEDRFRFEIFLRDDQMIAQNDGSIHYNCLDYFSTTEDRIITRHILQYDNLEIELDQLCRQNNMPKLAIDKINRSPRLNLRELYTEKSRELVRQKCEKDIAFFDYEFVDAV